MTTITHDPIDFVCGDTWKITLPDVASDGAPLDLNGATVAWRLDSIDGSKNFLSLENDTNGGIQTFLDTNGHGDILVTVPKAETLTLAPGSYVDWLRVTLTDGTTLTVWTGAIRAAANPA
jgi:hypothetical protein